MIESRTNQAVAIVGEVGSGKSTVMAGILGEVPVFRPECSSDFDYDFNHGSGGGGGGGEGSSQGSDAGAAGAPMEGVVAGGGGTSGGGWRGREDPARAATGRAAAVRVCYAAQAPWILSGTVRENVLFGLPMDQDRYRRDKNK